MILIKNSVCVSALESNNPQEVKLAISILKDLRVDPSTRKTEIDKLIKEATFERQALYQRGRSNYKKDYKLHQDIEKKCGTAKGKRIFCETIINININILTNIIIMV